MRTTHLKLGHCSEKIIRLTSSNSIGLPDLTKIRGKGLDFCDTCALQNVKAKPLKKASSEQKKSYLPMQLLQRDLCGPIQDEKGNKHYLDGFIDAHKSRYAIVFTIKAKTETAQNDIYVKQMVNEMHIERLKNSGDNLNKYQRVDVQIIQADSEKIFIGC